MAKINGFDLRQLSPEDEFIHLYIMDLDVACSQNFFFLKKHFGNDFEEEFFLLQNLEITYPDKLMA